MQRLVIILNIAFFFSGCFSINIPLNTPAKTYSQEIFEVEDSKDAAIEKQNSSTKKAAVLGAIMLGSISFLYVSSTEYEPIVAVVIFTAGTGGGAIIGHEIAKGKIKRQSKTRSVSKSGPSLNTIIIPTLLMGTAGYLIGDNQVWQNKLVTIEEENDNYGVAGAAIGGTLGYVLGNVISGRMQNQATATSDSTSLER